MFSAAEMFVFAIRYRHDVQAGSVFNNFEYHFYYVAPPITALGDMPNQHASAIPALAVRNRKRSRNHASDGTVAHERHIFAYGKSLI